MAFPDAAGFRLGTSRAFRWFDPVRFELTGLTVHPTVVMEATLDRPERMNLDREGASELCRQLIATTRRHHGDLVLLWHNSEVTDLMVARGSYQRDLYREVVAGLESN